MRIHHAILAGILCLALLLSGCDGRAAPAAQPPLALTLGAPLALEAALPLFIAQDQGFFARYGLTVTLRSYDTGLAAMAGLIEGEVDVAGPMSEYVLAGQGLIGAPVQALASIDRLEFTFLVARKDYGIQAIPDLRGKRIGVTQGTSAEFYLGRFLALHGIDPQEVRLADIRRQAEGAELLIQGAVDAFLSGEPYPSQAAAQLGDKAITWLAQSSQPAYALLAGRRDWLAQNPAAAERLLRGLDLAMTFIAAKPTAARPGALDRGGLAPALEQHVAQFRARTELDVRLAVRGFAAEGPGQRLPPDTETNLYRIAQEALTNAARYAEARQIDVMLVRNGGKVVLVVQDDGRGFDLEEARGKGRLGLLGMRERAEALNGRLTIESAPGKGARIRVAAPV